MGKKVIFITGTDEHGEKIATAASALGSSPSEHCDVVSQAYKALWKDVIANHQTILSLIYERIYDSAGSNAGFAFFMVLLYFWLQLDIAYDKFIRTTEAKHEAIVKQFYSRVLENGDIYQADYEGLYCVNCEEYKVRPSSLHCRWYSVFGQRSMDFD